jgi:large subunit ribosomal protein L25
MENVNLDSELRAGSGKGFARKLRSGGRVPAVLYGRKEEPVSLEIEEAAIRSVLHSNPESTVIDLTVKGGGSKEPVMVIVRDVQRHPATGRVLHVDFQRIKYGEKLRVEINIAVSGTPRGVKEQGGILEHGTRSVQVMCLPRNIPEAVDIDVAELMIGDALKLKDLVDRYPDMDFLDDPETTLAHVIPPIVEAKVEEEVAEEEAEAEPELVAKEKEGEEPKKGEPEEKESA